MSKFIELTAINLDLEKDFLRLQGATQRPRIVDADLADEAEAAVPAPTGPVTEPEGLYYPVMVAVDDIREFYPRRSSENTPRSGTRVVFKNGAATPVKEDFAAVKAKIASATRVRNPEA